MRILRTKIAIGVTLPFKTFDNEDKQLDLLTGIQITRYRPLSYIDGGHTVRISVLGLGIVISF